MTTKVLILAGGEGKRLWPLTDRAVRPKPNVYMGGSKRMLEYVADGFVQADYSHLYIAVQHMADSIMKAFGDGSNFVYGTDDEPVPLKITYTHAPPGKPFDRTADALRKSRVYLADKVIVLDRETQKELEVTGEEYLQNKGRLKFRRFVDNFEAVIIGSGDVLTSLKIRELVRFHKERGGIATMATYRIDDIERIRGHLGTVIYNADGKIVSFEEKPEEPKSNDVNAGIYVLDAAVLDFLDKHGDIMDFGSQLFPEFLRQNQDVFAFPINGYWNDVGTHKNYRATNLAMIEGISGIDNSSHVQRRQSPNRNLSRSDPSILAQGCTVERGATVSNSVLINDVRVQKGARVEDSVIISNTDIGEGVHIKDATIDGEVVIERGAEIGRNVVIGKKTHVKSSAVIRPDDLMRHLENTGRDVSGKYYIDDIGLLDTGIDRDTKKAMEDPSIMIGPNQAVEGKMTAYLIRRKD